MRPFIYYFGGKHRLAKFYGPPRRKVVVEPFAGGAGYSTYWNVEKVILVDRNERLCAMWRWLIKEATRDDIMALDPHLTTVADCSYPQPVRDFIAWNFAKGDAQPRNKMTDHQLKRRVIGGAGTIWSPQKRQIVADQIHRIKAWEIIQGDYAAAPAGDFHYHVDPPYINMGEAYTHGPKQLDFQALADWCKSKRCIDVCEGNGAEWLPFEPLRAVRDGQHEEYQELLWRRGGNEEHPLLARREA